MLIASVAPPATPELHHHFHLSDEERFRQHGRGTHTQLARLTVSEPTTVVFEWTIGEDRVVAGMPTFPTRCSAPAAMGNWPARC